MNVQDTIVTMMKAYPFQYCSRFKALFALFDTLGHWVNGELVLNHVSYVWRPVDRENPASSAKELETLWGNWCQSALDASDRVWKAENLLRIKRDIAQAQFVIDNAELLAITNSKDSLPPIAHFSGARFLDMPKNVTKDWRLAAVELANEIATFKYAPTEFHSVDPDAEKTAAVIERTLQLLEQWGVLGINHETRIVRIEKLRREALALGLRLVEEDSLTSA